MKAKLMTVVALLVLLQAALATAGPDQFIGDAAIYSGTATASVRPNILLLIDNSNATLNAAHGTKYDPNMDYCATYGQDYAASCTYRRFSVYQAGQQGSFSTNSVVDNTDASLSSITCNLNNNVVKTTLSAQGTYAGSGSNSYPNLKKGTGRGGDTAVCDTTGKGTTYALGNFLNYTLSPPFGGESQRQVVYEVIKTVLGGARFAVNFGAMVYGNNNKGGKVVYQIGDLSSDANFSTFLSLIPGVDGNGNLTGEPVLSSQTARPQAESLLDAGYYFKGEMLPVSEQPAMASPVTQSCAKNHVILITNGLSNKDDSPQLATIVGDLDGDGAEAVTYGLGTHYLDDVAKYLYERMTKGGEPLVVSTNTILAFQAEDSLVRRTADANHGRGHYYIAADANQLAGALSEAITNIMLESNSSFVAPVVPVSPENRTFSGRRVYMGFFKPMSASYWRGNVKKYGVNDSNALTDQEGELACYTDNNGDNKDDFDNATLPSGTVNGSFRATASSFWSSGADAGNLEAGGAGEVLFNRNYSVSPRKIYTYTGSNSNLTDLSNAFTGSNSALTAAMLNVTDETAKNELIDFVYGNDAYDENANGNTTEKRGGTSSSAGWIFGDVLHSRPVVVNYASYTFTAANESNCSLNKAIIFVGANDGMLHAIKDCDGSEAWAFLPPDLLPSLEYMPLRSHTYFVDSTPVAYIYNQSNDGNIVAANGDKVILLFGERRGGGLDAAPTSGSYFALDVTDPTTPRFLWRISNQSSGFDELGETWSEPKLVKMRINSGETAVDKIVAFVGAGYDNIHEDARYGNIDTFTDAAAVSSLDVGNGNVASGGAVDVTALTSPKGRGVYAIEVATLGSDGVPSLTHSGAKIWGYVYGSTTNESVTPPNSATNSLMKFSIPSEIAAADLDRDGYADTLYVGDTGGRVWKFRVGSPDVSSWRGVRLFNLNSGTGVVGKKFFYKPAVVQEPSYTMLFLGSGDREHPLNRDANLVDRMYALKDLGQTTAANLSETSLTDVTADLLQSTTAESGATSISGIQSALNTSYGWYVSLDEAAGRKILSSPTVFNKVAYFTAFTPNTVVDPCRPGNLGSSRLYALDYKTGAAVMDYDKSNDSLITTNPLAKANPGEVLQRSDRSVALGAGIPSGMVIMIAPSGDPKALIGVGGIIAGVNPKKGGSVLPLYWRQK